MFKSRLDIVLLGVGLVFVFLMLGINLWLGDVIIPFRDIVTILSGGEVENSSWSYIIENRWYRSIVALLSGASLAVCGLILQVYFRNPLAGPGVLGITSGASLGVAFVLLGGFTSATWLGQLGAVSAGIIGAILTLLLLLFLAKFIQNSLTLLVVGLMFGYFTSAIIHVLFLSADLNETRAFVLWGLGSFEGLTSEDMLIFTSLLSVTLVSSVFLIKPLNGLVLGQDYAASMGINLRQTKYRVILMGGILAAVVTVYCGPVSFIGIAVPQLVRMAWSSKNHKIQIPATMIVGALLALCADSLVRISGSTLPLNTVTALIGAPVIIYTIIKLRNKIA